MKKEIPSEAVELLRELPDVVREFGETICLEFVREFGANLYVKTIYVGVEIDGEMIAALYPKMKELTIEMPLALSEGHSSKLLTDATHLTWRSLPLMVKVDQKSDMKAILKLVREAASRVVNKTHDVHRDPEWFRGRTQRMSHDPNAKGKKT